jgi:hypothetical protein
MALGNRQGKDLVRVPRLRMASRLRIRVHFGTVLALSTSLTMSLIGKRVKPAHSGRALSFGTGHCFRHSPQH